MMILPPFESSNWIESNGIIFIEIQSLSIIPSPIIVKCFIVLTSSILLIERWNLYHLIPLIETNRITKISLKSNHWIMFRFQIFLNVCVVVYPSILVLERWNLYHSNPLIETNRMVNFHRNPITRSLIICDYVFTRITHKLHHKSRDLNCGIADYYA